MTKPEPYVPDLSWNNKHAGQDIFIIGSSPQLLQLTKPQLSALEGKIVIGGNLTYYKVPLTYFVSSYLLQCIIASFHLPEDRLIKLDTVHEDAHRKGFHHFIKGPYPESTGFNIELKPGKYHIATHLNQSLGMLNIAAIMGARRVIFIGVEQNSHAYYWQLDKSVLDSIRQDVYKLQTAKYLAKLDDYSVKMLPTLFQIINQDPSERDELPFVYDHTELFKAYFYDLKCAGIEPIATLENSVIHRSGAEYVPLDSLLR